MSRSHRSSITPMDFEWSNQTGPVDKQSPFLAASQQQKKRPHSVLDSPSKNGFATPQRLRDPNNRMNYFSQDPNRPLPQTPASSVPAHVQPGTWQIRTPAHDTDFSSGGETPNTPQVDSDAGTPDTQLAGKKGRRGSWAVFKDMFSGSPSPSKEREKADSRRPYSKKGDNRIAKRRERPDRSRSKKRSALQRSDDSDTEQASADAGRQLHAPKEQAGAGAGRLLHAPKEQTAVQQPYLVDRFFSWIEVHPFLPSVLTWWLQLLVAMSIAGSCFYLMYSFWAAIMADVDIESSKHRSEVMIEISACATEYRRNRCRPEEVVPAMEKACGLWETCMSRDPKKVARASVTAKTFAMIFNSFVEEFSYKSMIFTAIIIFGGFNLSNWAFGLLRSHQPAPPQQQNDFVPQTPHRVPSNSYIDQNQHNFQHAYQQNWQQLPPYQQQTPFQNHTPYAQGQGQMRHIEAPPPPLIHAHSMPALPSVAQKGGAVLV
ncbi:hypothetical protein EJ02DRAFT_449466 [Clathrospora elynae]|uniref:Brl1/Brr6 domain-containing protein n=1 Tax=Clathrospora elynae TaxID=706981 RepID=A0A6A5T601_9PLEO|nr:hypothetical protein EJ02DRAFT_449466 [Clathrospora elynae]